MDDRMERIRTRAYDLWQQAGRPDGRHDEHWAQAVREVDADDRGDDPVPIDAVPDGGEDLRRTAEADIDRLTPEDATGATMNLGVGGDGGEPEARSRRPI